MSGLDVRTSYDRSPKALHLGELHRDLRSAVEVIQERGLSIVFVFIQVDEITAADPGEGGHSRRIVMLLRRATYEHDAIAFAIQGRVVLLLACQGLDYAQRFCETLLDKARDTSSSGDDTARSITLSIGLASLDQECTSVASSTLFSLASSRARAASAAGGDQIVFSEPEEQPGEEDAGQNLEEERSPELERSRRELAEVRAELERAERAVARDVSERSLLERRIQKLCGTLGQTEAELRRLSNLHVDDSGKPSIYREVQGLSEDDDRHDERMSMMTSIFEANLELKRHAEGRDRESA